MPSPFKKSKSLATQPPPSLPPNKPPPPITEPFSPGGFRRPRPLSIGRLSSTTNGSIGLGISLTQSPGSLTRVDEGEGSEHGKSDDYFKDYQNRSTTQKSSGLRPSGRDLSRVDTRLTIYEATKQWTEETTQWTKVYGQWIEESKTPTSIEAQLGRTAGWVNEVELEGEENEIATPEDLQRKLNAPRPPLPPGTPANIDQFIHEQLEENYLGQANTFVRAAKSRSINSPRPRSAVRSFSVPAITRSLSEPTDSSCSPTQLRSATSFYTPTKIATARGYRTASVPARQRKVSAHKHLTIEPAPESTPVREGTVLCETYGETASGAVGTPVHATYGHRLHKVPSGANISITKRRSRRQLKDVVRGPLYFTESERQAIAELVLANLKPCEHHVNCTDCTDIRYALFENKAMPTSMPPEERQKIINNNRSLRNIKNELENLAEHGAISDDAYDTILRSLPEETSLNGAARSNPAPSPSPVPTNAFANMKVNNDPPPPAYNTQGPPALPSRTNSKPELARVTALYRYIEPQDCAFEVGDEISVTEKTNADWWWGTNLRTGKEGVFPVNYVQVQTNPSHNEKSGWGNEKAQPYQAPAPYQQPYQAGPPPPGPSNPYNAAVPPMAVAETPSEPGKPGKGQEMGKKFGKKLGNAAIFGAGATIGGNIVNSIF